MMRNTVVPTDAAVSPMVRQSFFRGANDFWAVIKPMRGMRSCVFIGCAASAFWFSCNVFLMSKSQADSETVNFAGRLRFLTQQMGVGLLAARYLPHVHIRGNGSASLSRLDMISSALLGESYVEGIPPITDDEAGKLLKQWREDLGFFHDLYRHPDITVLAHETLDRMILRLDSLTILANEVVDKISYAAASRVRLLLALSCCHLASASLWGILVAWLVGKFWRPFVDVYNREQDALLVINEQAAVIEEQRVENAEHQLGQLLEFPGKPHFHPFVKQCHHDCLQRHGHQNGYNRRARGSSVAKRSSAQSFPCSSVSTPRWSIESASASTRSSVSSSIRSATTGSEDTVENFKDDDTSKPGDDQGDSLGSHRTEKEHSSETGSVYDLPSISECSGPSDGRWQVVGDLQHAREVLTSPLCNQYGKELYGFEEMAIARGTLVGSLMVKMPPECVGLEGLYNIVDGINPNGYPLWKQCGGDYWIFSGLQGMVLFGDSEQAAVNFECSEGAVASVHRHNGNMPQEIVGWQRDDEQLDSWIVDDRIKIYLHKEGISANDDDLESNCNRQKRFQKGRASLNGEGKLICIKHETLGCVRKTDSASYATCG